MYPNAGDVQAPTPSATPSGGKKKHVYREEWEMDEGAYGSNRRETPYSMLIPTPLPFFFPVLFSFVCFFLFFAFFPFFFLPHLEGFRRLMNI